MRYTQNTFDLSDQHLMLVLLPSESIAVTMQIVTLLWSLLLHLVLVKSKLDKAVITHVFIYDFWIPSVRVLQYFDKPI